MTPRGSSGSSPVMLDGADSTAGAPGGGDGLVAPGCEPAASGGATRDATRRDTADPATPISARPWRLRFSLGKAIGRETPKTPEPCRKRAERRGHRSSELTALAAAWRRWTWPQSDLAGLG